MTEILNEINKFHSNKYKREIYFIKDECKTYIQTLNLSEEDRALIEDPIKPAEIHRALKICPTINLRVMTVSLRNFASIFWPKWARFFK